MLLTCPFWKCLPSQNSTHHCPNYWLQQSYTAYWQVEYTKLTFVVLAKEQRKDIDTTTATKISLCHLYLLKKPLNSSIIPVHTDSKPPICNECRNAAQSSITMISTVCEDWKLVTTWALQSILFPPYHWFKGRSDIPHWRYKSLKKQHNVNNAYRLWGKVQTFPVCSRQARR